MTLKDYVPIIIAFIAALVPGVLALIKTRSQKHKDDSDAAESLSNAAASLIEPFRKRVEQLEADREKDRLEREVDRALIRDLYFRLRVRNAYIEHLVQVVQSLTTQIINDGHVPVCGPTTIEEIEKQLKQEG